MFRTILNTRSIFFLLLFVSNLNAQINSEEILLKWKINKNDTLTYQTAMNQIGDSEFNFNFKEVFGNVLNNISDSIPIKKDSLSKNLNELDGNEIFKKVLEASKKVKLETRLFQSQKFVDIIDIEMSRTPIENIKGDSTEIKDVFPIMTEGIQLKGSIFEDGSIHSFWLNNSQRNLISLYFELPKKPVKIGDKWTLKDLNYIQYGNIFICDEAEKRHEVTLLDIKEQDGDKIAVIEYDIYEYVLGKIDFMGSVIPSRMEVMYKAKTEFSVNRGKWISYNGFLSIDSEGMMSSKSKQEFKLIEKL